MSQDLDRQALLARLFGRADVPEALTSPLLRTGDVAVLFQVSERTVDEWARRGRIPSLMTPGGQRRYPSEEIRKLLASGENRPGTSRRGPSTARAGS